MPYDPPRPGNPAMLFVTGSESRHFEYEPGSDPWYVSMHTKDWRALDLVLFANSRDHAIHILRELCEFWKGCLDQYAEYQSEVTGVEHPVIAENRSHSRRKLEMFSSLLEGKEVSRDWITGSGRERSDPHESGHSPVRPAHASQCSVV